MVSEGVYHDYVSVLKKIFGAIGERVGDATFLSLVSWKVQDDKYLQYLGLGRVRQHILLYWERGWAKSSILIFIKNWLIPSWIRTKIGTEGSIAALRGSVVRRRIYIPRLALADVYIVPELASWIHPAGGESGSATKMLGVLNVALEEGEVEVDLIKVADILPEEIQMAKNYGVEITMDGTMKYKTKFVMWAATHSLDFLPKSIRDAFLSRFMIIKMPRSVLTSDLALELIFEKKDVTEEELRDICYNLGKFLMNLKIKIDLLERGVKLAKRVLIEEARNGFHVSPRVANYVRVISILYAHILPNLHDEALVSLIRRKVAEMRHAAMPIEEIILEFCRIPRTVKEIQEVTGLSRVEIHHILRRLPVLPQRDEKTGVIRYVTKSGWEEGEVFSE